MTVRFRLPIDVAGLRWASNALVLAGLIGSGAFVWSRGDAWVYQRVQTGYLEQAADLPPAKENNLPLRAAAPPRSAARNPFRVFAPDPHVLGEIYVPRLGVRSVIRDGADLTSLRRAVGHVAGTALPGTQGNSVIAGHRDTFFRALRGIERGDAIRVRTANGAWTYAVDSLAIVEPSAVEVMRPSTEPRITLITCFPFDYVGPSPRRLVIGARAVQHP